MSNEKKEGVVEGQETEVVEHERSAEEIEADEAFAAGVANVRGAVPHEGVEPGDEQKKAAAEAAAKATAEVKAKAESEAKAKEEAETKAAAAAADPWKDVPPVVKSEFEKLGKSVTEQMRKLSGHVGGIISRIDQITAAATASAEKKGEPAPTKLEIAEALSDPDKWKQLQEDFPEWMGPVAAEFTRLRKEVAAVAAKAQEKPAPAPAAQPAAAATPSIDPEEILAGAEERAVVRIKHPDWKAICASPDFAKKDAEGKIVGGWLATASKELQAKTDSLVAEDAIEVFDAYKAHRDKLAKQKADKEKQERRLAGAVTVQGSAEPPKPGINDEEAFEAGVKKTLGGRK